MKRHNTAVNSGSWKGNPFYEVWYFKLNQPKEKHALWVRFLLLDTHEKRQGNVWAIYLPGDEKKEIVSLKNEVADQELITTNKKDHFIQIGKCFFGEGITRGQVGAGLSRPVEEKQTIQWNLSFEPDKNFTYCYAPSYLSPFLSSKAFSPNVNIKFSGDFQVGEQKIHCEQVPGAQSHYYGKHYARNWAWAHCNSFDTKGNTLFEAIDVKTSPFLPRFKSVLVRYQGENFINHDPISMLLLPSRPKENKWSLVFKKRGLSFQIEITGEEARFVDVEYEDTDHSKLVCHNTKLANSILSVYRNGKMVDRFASTKTTAFEVVSRL